MGDDAAGEGDDTAGMDAACAPLDSTSARLDPSRARPPQPPMSAARRALPIFEYMHDLADAIAHHPFLVVAGDTGSGKTTQLPQYVVDLLPATDFARVVVTQPRRIAAIAAASRVAAERSSPLGGPDVGFAVRFERRLAPDTRIAYMTDGALLRMCVRDPRLDAFDLVVLDEAHERSVDTDLLFGLVRRAAAARQSGPADSASRVHSASDTANDLPRTSSRSRRPLHVVVMSATLDVDKFSDFFGSCPVFSVPGRMFDVDIMWQPKGNLAHLASSRSAVPRAVSACMHIFTQEQPGDVLVFLPGQNDIEAAIRDLADRHAALRSTSGAQQPRIALLPLYSTLPTHEQRQIFEPTPRDTRKFVFATNIAQTSVTVPGIRFVVDAGLAKVKAFDPRTGADALVVTPISQADAAQRAGRAGRTASGRVFRLYSRQAFESMSAHPIPEIQRASLIATVLALKRLGVRDVLHFDFLDPPDPALVVAASVHLYLLEFDCLDAVATIAAMISCEDPFAVPRSRGKQAEAEKLHATEYSKQWCHDHFLHYRALKSARSVRDQLLDICSRLRVTPAAASNSRSDARPYPASQNPAKIVAALCRGLFMNAARRHPVRGYFTPYLAATAPASRSSGTSASGGKSSSAASLGSHLYGPTTASLMPLHIHPQSSLAPRASAADGSGDPAAESDIDWVVFGDVQIAAKAHMRGVCRIGFSMVDTLLKRASGIDVDRIMGIRNDDDLQDDSQTALTDTSVGADGAGGSSGADSKQLPGSTPLPEDIEADRAAHVEAARQRYLARKKAKQ
nr:DEAH-box ATP-dependent RNA helicase prp22 [Polyrhizophydium stewartii]